MRKAHLETLEMQSRDKLLPADSVDPEEADSAEVRESLCNVAEADAGAVLRTGRKALARCGARNE